MSKHISFGKIPQFRNLIRSLTLHYQYEGLGENGDPIYDVNKELPIVPLRSTIKIHGSNAGISLQNDEIVFLTRNRVTSGGHFGFVEMMKRREEVSRSLFDQIKETSDWKEGEIISVWGEICGPGVQKGVAMAQCENNYWVIFGAKITDQEGEGRWIQNIQDLKCSNDRVFNIYDFPTATFSVDLNNPKLIVNDITKLTEEIERECPVAKQLEGVSGIGEGLVLECFVGDKRFTAKSKGEKHSVSKVKKLNSVSVEKLKSIEDFVTYAVTPNRVNQFMDSISAELQEVLDKPHTGRLVNAVKDDILAEELDTLQAANLTIADCGSAIAKRTRQIFFKSLDF